MSRYTLSQAADADIRNIVIASIKAWGLVRAERYILELHTVLESLAAFPGLGRDAGYLRAGYFQFPTMSHTIFYQKTDGGLFIVRILHEKQMAENAL